jgi:cob(I)alamin adenosyltransferase
MGHRLTKITTRTGDDGTTGLADGRRLSKSAPRVQALGDVDELNSCLGLLRAESLPADLDTIIVELQQVLFDVGAELSMPETAVIAERHVTGIDASVQRLNAALPPLREFVLPGGGRAAALAHLARAICRRAERSLVALGEAEAVNDASRILLNRASDLLFVAARVLARASGGPETAWRGLQSGKK